MSQKPSVHISVANSDKTYLYEFDRIPNISELILINDNSYSGIYKVRNLVHTSTISSDASAWVLVDPVYCGSEYDGIQIRELDKILKQLFETKPKKK